MNDELANDRTFLAWLRTGVACFGLGFVVAKAALILRIGDQPVAHHGLYAATGVLIVLAGGALVVVGGRQHRAVARALGATRPARRRQTMTVVAVVAALVLSGLILAST